MLKEVLLESGKQMVRSWLKSHGYNRVSPIDSDDLEADSNMRRIFVHIKIFNTEHKSKPSESEKKKVIALSCEYHRDPWIAILEVDKNGELTSNIEWIDLSK